MLRVSARPAGQPMARRGRGPVRLGLWVAERALRPRPCLRSRRQGQPSSAALPARGCERSVGFAPGGSRQSQPRFAVQASRRRETDGPCLGRLARAGPRGGQRPQGSGSPASRLPSALDPPPLPAPRPADGGQAESGTRAASRPLPSPTKPPFSSWHSRRPSRSGKAGPLGARGGPPRAPAPGTAQRTAPSPWPVGRRPPPSPGPSALLLLGREREAGGRAHWLPPRSPPAASCGRAQAPTQVLYFSYIVGRVFPTPSAAALRTPRGTGSAPLGSASGGLSEGASACQEEEEEEARRGARLRSRRGGRGEESPGPPSASATRRDAEGPFQPAAPGTASCASGSAGSAAGPSRRLGSFPPPIATPRRWA